MARARLDGERISGRAHRDSALSHNRAVARFFEGKKSYPPHICSGDKISIEKLRVALPFS